MSTVGAGQKVCASDFPFLTTLTAVLILLLLVHSGRLTVSGICRVKMHSTLPPSEHRLSGHRLSGPCSRGVLFFVKYVACTVSSEKVRD